MSKKITPFLLEEVLEPLGIQAIICTHSPEILAHAYDDLDCTLLHLRSGRDASPIYPQDKEEVIEALRRLGSQLSDILFSHGSVYVEGEHDIELLNAGWPDRIAGYKLTKLGGRGSVEKEIRNLQAAEQDGNLDSYQCFIFDLDGKPTDLSDTVVVKVRQWERYCLENYLLDRDAIYDVCRAGNFTNVPTRGGLLTMLRDASLRQLRGRVAREVYREREPENPGFRPKDADAESYEEIGGVLLKRLETIGNQLDEIDSSTWLQEFEAACETRESELCEQWQENWNIHADGKRVLDEIFKQVGPKCSLLEFKRRIASEISSKKTESWRLVDSVLSSALTSS